MLDSTAIRVTFKHRPSLEALCYVFPCVALWAIAHDLVVKNKSNVRFSI